MYKLCKTEQSAQRQRELEQKLAELMNICRYEEITVSDFCAYAGIPRKAFYRYFSSKDGALYALLDHTMLEYEFFRASHLADSTKSLLLDLERFFQFWKNQQPLLDALEHSGLSGILMERAIQNVSEGVKMNQQLCAEDGKIREHVIRFSLCGIMIMMVNWHHGNYRESVQDMAKIAARLVSQPLLPIMKEFL